MKFELIFCKDKACFDNGKKKISIYAIEKENSIKPM